MDSGFEVLNFGVFVTGTLIRDSNRLRGSEFLEFNSGFLSPDSGFHKQKFRGFRIPNYQFKITKIK